jgi:hypothetical protein
MSAIRSVSSAVSGPVTDTASAQKKRLNERETYLAEQKQSAIRARKGRGGSYSLLGTEDRLG